MPKPPPCEKCGAQPEERRRCPNCGEAEWVLYHGAHYMQGAWEVIGCSCPSPRSALGRRKTAIRKRQTERVKAGKRADWNRPVTTPEMARKAAEGLTQGLSARRALEEAGFPASTVKNSTRGINKAIRGELLKMGHRWIQIGRELTVGDQEAMVRGRLAYNTITGLDKGVQSAKQLGADRRISMWQRESQTGLVVLQAPPMPELREDIPILPPSAHLLEEQAALEADRAAEREAKHGKLRSS